MSLLPFVNQMAAAAEQAQAVAGQKMREAFVAGGETADAPPAAVEGAAAPPLDEAPLVDEAALASIVAIAAMGGGIGPIAVTAPGSAGRPSAGDGANVLAQLALLLQACEIDAGQALQETTAQLGARARVAPDGGDPGPDAPGPDAAADDLAGVAGTIALAAGGAMALVLASCGWLFQHALVGRVRAAGRAVVEGEVPAGTAGDATPSPETLITVASRARIALEMLSRARRAAEQGATVAEIERIEQALAASRRFAPQHWAHQPVDTRALLPALDRLEMSFNALGFRCRAEGPTTAAFAPIAPLLTRLRRTMRLLRTDLNDDVAARLA